MTRVILVGLLAVAAACGGGPPTLPSFPSESSLAASRRAIGVPYRHWIACRLDQRPAVLELRAGSPLGDHVAWRWQWLEPTAEEVPAGSGTAVERRGIGRISVGNRTLEWSRGSGDFGWVYWPEKGFELEVYSRPFESPEAARRPSGGVWLRSAMFDTR